MAHQPGRFDPAGPYEVAVDDVVYSRPEPGVELRASVYRPVGDGAPVAGRVALVDAHGGAWRYFDRSVDAYFDRALAACGAVVVALDFRQAPSHRWPSAAADVSSGIRWVKAHAAPLGVDPRAVGSIGGSSGGHLVLVNAVAPDHPLFTSVPIDRSPPPLAGLAGFPEVTADDTAGLATGPAGADAGADAETADASVRFVLPLWPIAQPDDRYRYLLKRLAHPDVASHDPMFDPERLKRAQEAFFGDEATMREASVLTLLAERRRGLPAHELPPIWVAHPAQDENVTLEMTTALVDAYRHAGGSAELMVFEDAGHSFANFGSPKADECIAHMVRFVASQLAPAATP